VVTLDGTQHLYLEAFAPLTGFTALASTLQGSAAPTTVLYAAQAGGSGTTLAHYEVYLATDYTLTTAGTPYAVLTYTPAAGVWHVTAAAQCQTPGSSTDFVVYLHDGTNAVSGGHGFLTSPTHPSTIPVAANIVATGTSVVSLMVSANDSAALVKAEDTLYSEGAIQTYMLFEQLA
jgi:hypothetical protein